PRRRLRPRWLGLPQEGGRLLRRGAPVVRSPGQGRQRSGRLLSGLRRPAGASPARRPPLPAPGLGRRPEAPGQDARPAEVTFREGWRIALSLLDEAHRDLPGAWVAGDDEFGRCTQLRGELRRRRLRYVLDVPCHTLVRDPTERRPPRRPGGKPR